MYISTTFSNNIFHLVVNRTIASRSRSTGPNDIILSYTDCGTADVAGICDIIEIHVTLYIYVYRKNKPQRDGRLVNEFRNLNYRSVRLRGISAPSLWNNITWARCSICAYVRAFIYNVIIHGETIFDIQTIVFTTLSAATPARA